MTLTLRAPLLPCARARPSGSLSCSVVAASLCLVLTACRGPGSQEPSTSTPPETAATAARSASPGAESAPAPALMPPVWPPEQPARHHELSVWTRTSDGEIRGAAHQRARSEDRLLWWSITDGRIVEHGIDEIAHGGHTAQRPVLLNDGQGGLLRLQALLPANADEPGTLLYQRWTSQEREPADMRALPLSSRPHTSAPLRAAADDTGVVLCWLTATVGMYCARLGNDNAWTHAGPVAESTRFVPSALVANAAHVAILGWHEDVSERGWRFVVAEVRSDGEQWAMGERRDVGGEVWPASPEPPALQGEVLAALLPERIVAVLPVAAGRFARSAQIPLDPSLPILRQQSPPWAPPLEHPVLLHDQTLAILLLDSFGPDGQRSLVVFPPQASRPPQVLVASVPPDGPATTRVAGQSLGAVLALAPVASDADFSDAAHGTSLRVDPVARWLPALSNPEASQQEDEPIESLPP